MMKRTNIISNGFNSNINNPSKGLTNNRILPTTSKPLPKLSQQERTLPTTSHHHPPFPSKALPTNKTTLQNGFRRKIAPNVLPNKVQPKVTVAPQSRYGAKRKDVGGQNKARLKSEYSKYLQDALLCKIVRKEKKIAQNVLADSSVVSSLKLHFLQREKQIVMTKNKILQARIADVQWCEKFNKKLLAFAIYVTKIDPRLSQFIARLSSKLDVLPLKNCHYNEALYPIDWKALESAAFNLNDILCSQEKPFYYLRSLGESLEKTKKELEIEKMRKEQKLILNQKLTFLVSLKLCDKLYEQKFIKYNNSCLL